MNEFARFDAMAAEGVWRVPIFLAWLAGLACVFGVTEGNHKPFKHWAHFLAAGFLLAHICAIAYIAIYAAT